ncbi:hypothetical protein [Actinomadura sp. 9N215]|uniref:hypothetical protein n=1 Tax=Actinomadura sp. 9N215 TaxID=3375150 RepID=UPI003789C437
MLLTDRRAPSRTPVVDVCAITQAGAVVVRARAAELFEGYTRPLAHPDITDAVLLGCRRRLNAAAAAALSSPPRVGSPEMLSTGR